MLIAGAMRLTPSTASCLVIRSERRSSPRRRSQGSRPRRGGMKARNHPRSLVAPLCASIDWFTPMLLSEQMRLVRDQHQSELDQIRAKQTDLAARAAARPDKALLASEKREFDGLVASAKDLTNTVREDQ